MQLLYGVGAVVTERFVSGAPSLLHSASTVPPRISLLSDSYTLECLLCPSTTPELLMMIFLLLVSYPLYFLLIQSLIT